MNAAELFVRCLEEQGVEVIFGVPGEENSDFLMALSNSKIKFIICRHEQTASFMADMHGRLTGHPGVCLSTLGPGATNLITGVANANMDNVPLIAIVGQASTDRLHKESHQNMNAVEMYRPVTKWAISILEARVVPEIVYKAFDLAIRSKPGAVMVELPEDIAKQKVNLSPLPRLKGIVSYGVTQHRLNQTLNLIAESKKPLLLIGTGASATPCEHEIAEFMDKTNIYSASTFMGKGVVSAKSPLSLFCVGLGLRDIVLDAFFSADLVICVGYRMVEWHPDRWNIKDEKKIIHIDVAPAEVDKNYLPDVELVGEIPQILNYLNSELNETHLKDPTIFADVRERIVADLDINITNDSYPVKPQRLLHDVRLALRDHDILISDVGAHKMWVARQYLAYHTNTCIIYNGFCAMGGALPGAIEAKQLHPRKNVVALCGDGAFVMSIQALITAVQLKTPIVALVWQDDSYGLIKWKQEMEYHRYTDVDLENPNLVAVAKAFGCHGVEIKAASQLKPALEEAFKEKSIPTVIVVAVDYSENMKLTKRLGEIISH